MVSFLLNIILWFVQGIVGLFPTSSGFGTSVFSAFESFGDYLWSMDVIVPVGILLTCLSLLIGVEVAIFGFRVIRWLISHIPQFGGKG